ncbi:MAG: signal recognition particle-docking protein FtsY [Treponemataceae bacterium]
MGKMGFADRLKALFGRGGNGDDFFDDLADSLVEGDLGASESFSVVDRLKAVCRSDRINDPLAVKEKLAELLRADLLTTETGMNSSSFDIVLLLGVNGVGKTTTAAKLASYYRLKAGKKPLLAAADTFRAAAIDQLKIHGERLEVQVVAHKHGGDPAAVVFDSIEAARARSCDLIVADTAGRMHTKAGLIEELKKIDRVVESKASGARYRKFLVLDSTTGRNAFAQAETFLEAVRLDGVILTKYDSSARGGVAFAVCGKLKLPIAFVCTGEGYGDIAPFDPDRYVREFVGLA